MHVPRTVMWIPLALAGFFVLCETQSSSNAASSVLSNWHRTDRHKRNTNEFDKSALSEPGVIVGIIVGVAGVLVVIGVTVLLCRLFCCRQQCVCCPCCQEEETYLEASTAPIKIPSQDSAPDKSKPDGSRSEPQTRPTKRGSRKATDNPPTLPSYDDVPQLDWKLDDGTKNEKSPETEVDGGSRGSPISRGENSLALPPNDREYSKNLPPVFGLRRQEKTPARRKLTYETDNLDLSEQDGGFNLKQHERPENGSVDATRHKKEFPSARPRKHGKRDFQLSPPNEDRTVSDGRTPDQTSDGREFPLLEFEPQKRSFNPSYPSEPPRPWAEEAVEVDNELFKPVEFDRPPHSFQPSYAEHRGPMWEGAGSRQWEGERRPWQGRDVPAPRSPVVQNSYHAAGAVYSVAGHTNPAFNQDCTETEV